MSLRDEWVFQHTAGRLADHAEREADYHRMRAEWWDGELTRAIERAHASGVEVREVQQTNGRRAQLVVDATVQNDLNRAQGRRDHHIAQAEEYEMWADSFKLQDEVRVYELHPDDVLFFNLAGTRHREAVEEGVTA